MILKILVDMNLSPDWVPIITRAGWGAVHWSVIGDPHAPDEKIFHWAQTNGYCVLTHDLDFARILALSHSTAPSVIQIRTDDALADELEHLVLVTLKEYEHELSTGAIIVVEEGRNRVRILPI